MWSIQRCVLDSRAKTITCVENAVGVGGGRLLAAVDPALGRVNARPGDRRCRTRNKLFIVSRAGMVPNPIYRDHEFPTVNFTLDLHLAISSPLQLPSHPLFRKASRDPTTFAHRHGPKGPRTCSQTRPPKRLRKPPSHVCLSRRKDDDHAWFLAHQLRHWHVGALLPDLRAVPLAPAAR
ncbi:hypothetical protein V495_00705 [Pseudogymnoascus sp. VKM F-4514 (FW-929)]|nr:hypothetical protein V495_00705 [Pseudogymnoascus sp. VKM F-4514 (FW-929)]KFY65778.1 hypothetical protein V497_01282 [Pseudogymnoascus sp. VKM F-4516 (FW-969)]